MAIKWLRRLKKKHPTLAAKAEALDQEDDFDITISRSKKRKKTDED